MNEHIIVPEEPILEGFEIWDKLNNFCIKHWDKLYAGACRINESFLPNEIKNVVPIPKDAFAPERIEVFHSMDNMGETRFHFHQQIKYFAGRKYDDPVPPDALQIRNVVKAIQTLLDSYGTNQKFTFLVEIKD